VQYHEGVRAKWLAKKRGELYKHPYDLGIVRNVFTVSVLAGRSHRMPKHGSSFEAGQEPCGRPCFSWVRLLYNLQVES
jgi:hypothetical protein